MTYNVKSYLAVRQADGFARPASEIARHDPDVLVMQDAPGLTPPNVVPAPLRAALASRSVYRGGEYLVASRYPLRDFAPLSMSYVQHDVFVRCVSNCVASRSRSSLHTSPLPGIARPERDLSG